MRVEIFERARFYAFSHNETFLVDLLLFRNAGACSCFHYLKHLKPEIERAIVDPDWRPTDANRCPHIREARRVMLDMFLEQLALKFNDNELEP